MDFLGIDIWNTLISYSRYSTLVYRVQYSARATIRHVLSAKPHYIYDIFTHAPRFMGKLSR